MELILTEKEYCGHSKFMREIRNKYLFIKINGRPSFSSVKFFLPEKKMLEEAHIIYFNFLVHAGHPSEKLSFIG
jgi:hypothetical protein